MKSVLRNAPEAGANYSAYVRWNVYSFRADWHLTDLTHEYNDVVKMLEQMVIPRLEDPESLVGFEINDYTKPWIAEGTTEFASFAIVKEPDGFALKGMGAVI